MIALIKINNLNYLPEQIKYIVIIVVKMRMLYLIINYMKEIDLIVNIN